MTTFAQVKSGTVINVIVAEQDFIDSLPTEENVEWVQTDNQTINNRHVDSGTPLRGNHARIGGLYLKEQDVFCDVKPGIDWTLDKDCEWQPPIPFPSYHDDTLDLVRWMWDDNLYKKDNTKGWVFTVMEPLDDFNPKFGAEQIF